MMKLAEAAHLAIAVQLGAYLNNKGISDNGLDVGEADKADRGLRDGETFPKAFYPQGVFQHEGIDFDIPPISADIQFDNVRAEGQEIALRDPDTIAEFHLLATGDGFRSNSAGENHKKVSLLFEDGTTHEQAFESRNWWTHNGQNKGVVRAPYRFVGKDKSSEAANIFHLTIPVPTRLSDKKVQAIRLPSTAGDQALHIFALSYLLAVQAQKGEIAIEDRAKALYAKSTSRWEDIGDDKAQVVEIAVRNPIAVSAYGREEAWVTSPIEVSISGSNFETLRSAKIVRLMPSDQVLVELPVKPKSTSVTSFKDARVDLTVDGKTWHTAITVEGPGLIHGTTSWTPENIDAHSAPRWFRDAKLGIFIHFGLFSIPGWGDIGDGKYAEWYWYWMNGGPQMGGTYAYHKETYGEDFNYDDFIPQFTVERYDPKAWVKLFEDAGARYFVFTTKHHDGFALFDAEDTSARDSVRLGPKRDLFKELMDASEGSILKRGAYFSMPEWYNPLYNKYAEDPKFTTLPFRGGPATNPYTGREEAYTGLIEKDDYVSGLQVPQMRILTDKYKPDILWGDIGLANDSKPVIADYFNSSAASGRQVTVNDRLGIAGDFNTPEMERFATVQPLWEACESVDPYSFGYNRQTSDSAYRSPADLVHTLVDIVAKGGNFLLNVGPRGDGSIPHAVQDRLRALGAWLEVNGRAIYGSYTFALVPGSNSTTGVPVVTTRTDYAFYVIALEKPEGAFTVPAPLPVRDGDKVSLLTREGDMPVQWSVDGSGSSFSLALDGVKVDPEGLAWTFEIKYGG